MMHTALIVLLIALAWFGVSVVVAIPVGLVISFGNLTHESHDETIDL